MYGQIIVILMIRETVLQNSITEDIHSVVETQNLEISIT